MPGPKGGAAEVTVEVGAEGSGLLRFSVSQLERFTSCEWKWLHEKQIPSEERVEYAKSQALDLGTLMHTLMGAWYAGRPWRTAFIAAAEEAVGSEGVAWEIRKGLLVPSTKGWETPAEFARAAAIMEAWEEVHGTSPAEDPDPEGVFGGARPEIVGLELPFDLPIPGHKDARIRGFIDGVVSLPAEDGVKVHDTLRLLEFKTMGRWGREDRVPFDLQLNVYMWAARHLFGDRLDGAVFEAISTYNYKTDSAGYEPSKRFKRLPLAYDPRLVDRTMADVTKAVRRAKQILKNPGLAIRSVGEACTYCDHRTRCLTPWEL